MSCSFPCQRTASLGNVETLVSIPVPTSHHDLPDEALQATGVTHDMVRLSVGIEDAKDILADLDSALESSRS